MSTEKEQVLVGAWSIYTSKIDEQAQQAFKEATHGLVGVSYSPVAVSQQVVAGMNYRFFCNTKLITPIYLNGAAIVSVYKPLKGEAHITSITPIHL
ncbi:MAG TPA: hypothetical protein PKK00_04580 [Bacteroidales bacterium]|nr:hypothetical protein [Bacteroidales bacterium]HPS16686.1 hypothetical protein [Bacteroidales bacterium]